MHSLIAIRPGLALTATLTLWLVMSSAFAAPKNQNAVTAERIAQLPADRQAAWTQYFEKSQRQMQIDKDALNAEMKAAGLTKPIAPPRGPSFYLDSSKAAAWYGSPEALKMADIIVSFQTPSGGWGKHIKMDDHVRQPGEFWSNNDEWHYVGTFDNGATYNHMLFLAKAFKAAGREAYSKSFLGGLNYILMAQYPNGGWPQVYPLTGGYSDDVTFNDGAMINTLTMLRAVALGEYDFVPADLRRKAEAAMKHGIDCLLAAQVEVNGVPTVWCAQHDPLTLKPAKARAYELISLSGGESSGIVLFLMGIEDPSPEVVKIVNAAVAWYERSKVTGIRLTKVDGDTRVIQDAAAPPLWGRFYDIETNRPMFCGRDGIKKWDIAMIEAERRNGYNWYGEYGGPILKNYPKWKERLKGAARAKTAAAAN